MHAWETIEHSLDYIDEHLGEEVKIEELAGMAALSPFYFQRLFKRLVHKPVQEYVKLRRLAKAVEALRDPSRRILDVALDYGFSSQRQFHAGLQRRLHNYPGRVSEGAPYAQHF